MGPPTLSGLLGKKPEIVMAKRRKKSSGGSCKVVRVKGQGMRRICRDRKGRIKSNKKA